MSTVWCESWRARDKPFHLCAPSWNENGINEVCRKVIPKYLCAQNDFARESNLFYFLIFLFFLFCSNVLAIAVVLVSRSYMPFTCNSYSPKWRWIVVRGEVFTNAEVSQGNKYQFWVI